MSFFSIVIPVYNVESYIGRCIQSIQNQSFGDFEAILVDDASQDLSSDICKEVSVEDKRFRYKLKEHGGAAAARNYGIAGAAGKYVVFLDADDYIDSQFLEKISEVIVAGPPADICFMNSHYVIAKNCLQQNIVFHVPRDLDLYKNISGRDFLDIVTSKGNFMPGSAWLVIIRKDFLTEKKLKFDEKLIWSEDSDFVYRALINTDKIRCINYCGYYYFMENSESVSKKFSISKAMGRMDVYSKWALYFQNDANAGEKYSNIARENLAQQMWSEYCEFLNIYGGIKEKENKKQLYERLRAERKQWKQCRNYKYKDYVRYGIVLGTLLQKIKRRIKYVLYHKG